MEAADLLFLYLSLTSFSVLECSFCRHYIKVASNSIYLFEMIAAWAQHFCYTSSLLAKLYCDTFYVLFKVLQLSWYDILVILPRPY